MTLMRKSRIIAQAKKNQNLFTLDLALPGQVMSVRMRAMAITGWGYPTCLVSQNKWICIWHHRLAHITNAQVVKASKLVKGIDLALTDKKYDLAEVLINSKDSDIFKSETTNPQSFMDIDPLPMIVASTS